jgi:D-amino-acid oxidase
MDVLVIGAGVCGLTTGIRLAEAGATVTIRTAAPPEQTTSAAAGAVWGLVRVGPPDRVVEWGRIGLEVLSALAGEPGTGVRMASGQEVSRSTLEPHYWTPLLPGLRSSTPSELPDGFADGWHYTAPVVTMPIYLGYLRARFERAGGQLEVAPTRTLAELAGVAPVVVNCSGAAARDLVPDPAVMAVRGQVVIAANPGIEEFFIDRDPEPPWIVYMFPHGEQILLGGTNDEGNWDETPKTHIAERILAGCAAIDPRLRNVEILGHRVGLRPCRPEVRLESEPLNGGVLWHNYGHGGAGISLSWGCAAEIAASVVLAPGGRPPGIPPRTGGLPVPPSPPGAIGVLAELGDLGPVDVAVEPHADPAPVADVGRAKEAAGVRRSQFLLGSGWCRAPQVREMVIVMAVGPQRHEGALVPNEPGRGAVTGPFGDLRQGQADRAQPLGEHGTSIRGGRLEPE